MCFIHPVTDKQYASFTLLWTNNMPRSPSHGKKTIGFVHPVSDKQNISFSQLWTNNMLRSPSHGKNTIRLTLME